LFLDELVEVVLPDMQAVILWQLGLKVHIHGCLGGEFWDKYWKQFALLFLW